MVNATLRYGNVTRDVVLSDDVASCAHFNSAIMAKHGVSITLHPPKVDDDVIDCCSKLNAAAAALVDDALNDAFKAATY